MKTKKFLSMAALALVGAMTVSCSSDDNIIDQPQQPENKNNVVTLTTTVSLDGGATTRALTINGNTGVKTFAAGDQIAVIYTKNGGTVTKAVSEALPAGSYGANATFTVTLDDPDKTKEVLYIYPAAMADETGVDITKLNTQEGTFDALQSKYDVCTNFGDWDGDNLPSLTLENRLAILAINLKNGSTDITGDITGMTISDGTNTYSVTREAAAGPIYVAILPTSGATINVTATDGTNEYGKTLATTKTYAANNGYNVTWNMSKLKVTWNSTNVFKEDNKMVVLNRSNSDPLTYEGITISFSGTGSSRFSPYATGMNNALLACYGSDGDSFTFTAPSGQKFTKIEIIDNSYIMFTPYGDWTQPADTKIVWSGTATNAVTLGGSKDTFTTALNSIVFTLKDE